MNSIVWCMETERQQVPNMTPLQYLVSLFWRQ